MHRVAISDQRITAVDKQSVTFRYTPSGSKRSKSRKVSGQEFVRGFAQHVLPRGPRKVRYYGWMSPNSRIRLDEVRWLVWLLLGWTFWLASGHAPQPQAEDPKSPSCPVCGGSMQTVFLLHHNVKVFVEFSRAYFDSG